MREASYYQKHTKPFEPSIYQVKFTNSSTTAWVTTGGRLDKVSWIESHSYRKRLIKYQKQLTLIIGYFIAKGLRRYMDVRDCYFGKHTVNLFKHTVTVLTGEDFPPLSRLSTETFNPKVLSITPPHENTLFSEIVRQTQDSRCNNIISITKTLPQTITTGYMKSKLKT